MSLDPNVVLNHFLTDRFAAESGARLVEVSEGHARARLEVEPRHMNSVGIVQGGAIFTLADFAFAAACNAAGRVAVAVNTSLTFFEPTRDGTLEAEATEIARSRRLSNCTVRVTNSSGKLVALFQGTAFIKDQPFPPVSDT